MRFHFALTLWTSVCQAVQHYPAAWGHYDLCKFQIYTEEGLTWDYMACQPEAADMTQYLKVTLDPPNITCGDPPETYCALVSTSKETAKYSLFKNCTHTRFISRQPSYLCPWIVGLLGWFWPHSHDSHVQSLSVAQICCRGWGSREVCAHWRHVLLFRELLPRVHCLMCRWRSLLPERHGKMGYFQQKHHKKNLHPLLLQLLCCIRNKMSGWSNISNTLRVK